MTKGCSYDRRGYHHDEDEDNEDDEDDTREKKIYGEIMKPMLDFDCGEILPSYPTAVFHYCILKFLWRLQFVAGLDHSPQRCRYLDFTLVHFHGFYPYVKVNP